MKPVLLLVMMIFFAWGVTAAPPYRLMVKHDHALGGCRGTLLIHAQGVQYKTDKAKDQREWAFRDIQQIQFLSPKELAVTTYEDQKLKWGSDKTFKFAILDGEISGELYRFLLEKTGKPVVTKIPVLEDQPKYQIPAKHLHAWGGSQGTLIITADGIVYQAQDKKDSRTWRYTDIESIGPMDPYHWRLTTNERSRFHYAGRTDFNFVFKERMDEKIYEYVWERIQKMGPVAASEN